MKKYELRIYQKADTVDRSKIRRVEIDYDTKEIRYIFIIPGTTTDPEKTKEGIREHVNRLFPFLKKTEPQDIFDTLNNQHVLTLAISDPEEMRQTKEVLQSNSPYQDHKEEIKGIANDIDALVKTLNTQEPKFTTGQRSIACTKAHTNNKVLYKNPKNPKNQQDESYQICNGEIDFTQPIESLASVGENRDREVILLDPEHQEMKALYQEFVRGLETTYKTSTPSLNNIFAYAAKFSNQKMPEGKDGQFTPIRKSEHVTIGGEDELRPVYFLQDIIKEGRGVCRHHGFFTAFLLGKYFKNHPQDKLSIHQCRSNLANKSSVAAHTWAVCKQGEKLFFIDPMWDFHEEITADQGYTKACNEYGEDVVRGIFDRANLVSLNDKLSEALDRAVFYRNLNQITDPISIKEIQELIQNGANVNTKGNGSGWAAAHFAAHIDHIDLMTFLLGQKNVDVNVVSNHRQRTPLFNAKTAKVARLLLEKGAKLFIKDTKNTTPFVELKKQGIFSPDQPLSDLLTKRLAEELSENTGADVKVVQALIEEGADVNTQTGSDDDKKKGRGGWTAAHLAANQDDIELIELLAKKGADFNIPATYTKKTPLFSAKSEKMIEVLIKGGAKSDCKDYLGNPLSSLRLKKIGEMNQELEVTKPIQPVAQPIQTPEVVIPVRPVQNPKVDPTPLVAAKLQPAATDQPLSDLLTKRLAEELSKNTGADVKVVQALIEEGADVNTQTGLDNEKKKGRGGWTAAHLAANQDDIELIELLAKKGADFNIPATYTKKTPLFSAKSEKMIEVLIKGGAKSDCKDYLGNPLSSVILEKIRLMNQELEVTKPIQPVAQPIQTPEVVIPVRLVATVQKPKTDQRPPVAAEPQPTTTERQALKRTPVQLVQAQKPVVSKESTGLLYTKNSYELAAAEVLKYIKCQLVNSNILKQESGGFSIKGASVKKTRTAQTVFKQIEQWENREITASDAYQDIVQNLNEALSRRREIMKADKKKPSDQDKNIVLDYDSFLEAITTKFVGPMPKGATQSKIDNLSDNTMKLDSKRAIAKMDRILGFIDPQTTYGCIEQETGTMREMRNLREQVKPNDPNAVEVFTEFQRLAGKALNRCRFFALEAKDPRKIFYSKVLEETFEKDENLDFKS